MLRTHIHHRNQPISHARRNSWKLSKTELLLPNYLRHVFDHSDIINGDLKGLHHSNPGLPRTELPSPFQNTHSWIYSVYIYKYIFIIYDIFCSHTYIYILVLSHTYIYRFKYMLYTYIYVYMYIYVLNMVPFSGLSSNTFQIPGVDVLLQK